MQHRDPVKYARLIDSAKVVVLWEHDSKAIDEKRQDVVLGVENMSQ